MMPKNCEECDDDECEECEDDEEEECENATCEHCRKEKKLEGKPNKLSPEEILAYMNSETIIRIRGNPTPMFVRMINAEKQLLVEEMLEEKNVENPDVRKNKLQGYVT